MDLDGDTLAAVTPAVQRMLEDLAVLGDEVDVAVIRHTGVAEPREVTAAVAAGLVEVDEDAVRIVSPEHARDWRAAAEAEPVRALDLHRRAAEAAADRQDHTGAVEHLTAALRAHTLVTDPPTSRGALLARLARAELRSGSVDRAWDAVRRAAAAARADGDWAVLADAATVIRGALPGGWAQDADLYALCLEALERLGDADPIRRARLLAQLAGTANPWADRVQDGHCPLVPVDVDDAEVRFLQLRARYQELLHVEHVVARSAVADETTALGVVAADDEYVAWGQLWRIEALYQQTRRMELDAGLVALSATVGRLRDRLWDWRLLTVRASIAMLDDRIDLVRDLTDEAAAVGAACGVPEAAFVHVIWQSALAMATGEGLDEALDAVRDAVDGAPVAARAWWALHLLASGRTEEARAVWDAVAPHVVATPRMPAEWLISMTGSVDLVMAFDDLETARQIYDLLLPVSGVMAVVTAQTPADGPVDLALGRLARLLGDQAAARAHLQAARRQAVAMHAPRFVRTCEVELARLRPPPHPLSPRERDVAALVADGASNRAIGERLHLSERTVESHVSSIMRKLDLRSRAAVAAWQARRGATPST